MLHFLASIPRSGSTLLSSLLNQRDDTYVSPTSNLCDALGAMVASWEQNPATRASGAAHEDLFRLIAGAAEARYGHRREAAVLDKGRGWPAPQIMRTMERSLGREVKIVATVRPVRECLASFVRLMKPEDVREFCRTSELAQHIFNSYAALKSGYEAYPDRLLLIEYDDLVREPQRELDRVADFLELPRFTHRLSELEQVEESDGPEAWDIPNLHKLRSRVGKEEYDAAALMGPLWDYYDGGNFWRDEPEAEHKPTKLDQQLAASLRGDFREGWTLAQELEREEPDNDRAAFNRGWYLLQQGDLQGGHELLDRGRREGVFGNPDIGSSRPRWQGERNGTVLLNLEGGFGDQMHGVRFAKDIAKRGNTVVAACSPGLAPLVAEVEGVSAVVEHRAALGVYHTHWQPSMSTVLPLGLTYEDLSGAPYIPRLDVPRDKVGVRWSGNPRFEHEQHRLFPKELLFESVRDLDCLSLQDNEAAPPWMETPDLSSWERTREAISRCRLVISSCTAVAHLAASMGVETWIVVPVLPYYLWALPGERTPYYDSVRLFRQERYGEWEAPFLAIREALSARAGELPKRTGGAARR